MTEDQGWRIYNPQPLSGDQKGVRPTLPPPPPWRSFSQRGSDDKPARGANYVIDPAYLDIINAALYLRRPLLVTGDPGVGKTTLAYSIARELGLGEVLHWPINSRSHITEALYLYDPIERMRLEKDRKPEDKEAPVERYIRLGPLGTAFSSSEETKPRVLLIDEIDKADIDLPNDLLHILEEGSFSIPEIVRLIGSEGRKFPLLPSDGKSDADRIEVEDGFVWCKAFPVILMTSNGERGLPPALRRRCLQLKIERPAQEQLELILRSHGLYSSDPATAGLIKSFCGADGDRKKVAVDQLMNALFLLGQQARPEGEAWNKLINAVMQDLSD